MKLLIELLTGDLQPEYKTTESEIYAGEANLFRSGVSIGGKLFLTSERLIFLPHKFNFNKKIEYIELSEVNVFQSITSLNILNNTLAFTLENGTELIFIVNNIEIWMEEIERAKKVVDLI
ncbi:hypothetical protein [Tenacibaculum sp. 190524A05c]|uniref:hypothetical protein n=1 Tax=Tenacibaculum platacis TaxID=3137852 RepID=UPI0032B2B304